MNLPILINSFGGKVEMEKRHFTIYHFLNNKKYTGLNHLGSNTIYTTSPIIMRGEHI